MAYPGYQSETPLTNNQLNQSMIAYMNRQEMGRYTTANSASMPSTRRQNQLCNTPPAVWAPYIIERASVFLYPGQEFCPQDDFQYRYIRDERCCYKVHTQIRSAVVRLDPGDTEDQQWQALYARCINKHQNPNVAIDGMTLVVTRVLQNNTVPDHHFNNIIRLFRSLWAVDQYDSIMGTIVRDAFKGNLLTTDPHMNDDFPYERPLKNVISLINARAFNVNRISNVDGNTRTFAHELVWACARIPLNYVSIVMQALGNPALGVNKQQTAWVMGAPAMTAFELIQYRWNKPNNTQQVINALNAIRNAMIAQGGWT